MKKFALLALLGVSALLSGCSGVADTLGLGRNPPDEFAVVDRPPLALPPDFNLRPPQPGAARPQEINMSERASTLLYGAKPATDEAASDAEKAVLAAAGASRAEANIRDLVDRDASQKVVTSRRFVDDLLWWRDNRAPAATVDAVAEAKRIQDAKDNGEPVNKGKTPVIEKQKSGWLGL